MDIVLCYNESGKSKRMYSHKTETPPGAKGAYYNTGGTADCVWLE